jgi:hypothetical protein
VPGRRPGSRGNERLTAMTGAFVLVPFISECLTLIRVGNLLTLRVLPGIPCRKHQGSFGVKDLEGRACSCPWTWRGSGAGG